MQWMRYRNSEIVRAVILIVMSGSGARRLVTAAVA